MWTNPGGIAVSEILLSRAQTRLYTIQAPKKPAKGAFWIFFGWRSIILPTIRFWGGYALGSKIEKWRMAALDVEQLCET